MMLFYVVIAAFILIWGPTRCILLHFFSVIAYWFYDAFMYLYKRKWRNFNFYGIDMYIGMFGHGKTLCMTRKALKLYKRFGNRIRFISNYDLKTIPYIPLINFNQLVDLGEDDSDYVGTVVLIDEIENVLNNRSFASFPLQMLHMLTQQRKKHVYIMCSAQRFFMVDKLFRSITTRVIDCSKYWRLQRMRIYDAWDYENAMNPLLVQSLRSSWWFIRNKHFHAYDTEQMISKDMAENFISNEESIVRRGLEATVNKDAIAKPSLRLRIARRNKRAV